MMKNWLDIQANLQIPAVLITVAAVDGSGPREAGAKMLVTADEQFDTIGGGHLELRACELARDILVDTAKAIRLERFALGPSLGQCCGGVVHLAFEYLDLQAQAALVYLRRRLNERTDSWRLIALDDGIPSMIFDRSGNCLFGDMLRAPMEIQFERPCHLMRDRFGKRWLIDPCLAQQPHLILFGAGHVGAAIVRAMEELPCRITWVDEREDLFPDILPANVTIESTDDPGTFATQAPAGSTFLVLTHSHVLDLCISEHILRRHGNEWFGLIGSRTKRMQFEHRLAERGIAKQKLSAMICPIGLPGISDKSPAVIAASVAAQLLQVWEARNASSTDTSSIPDQDQAHGEYPTGLRAASTHND